MPADHAQEIKFKTVEVIQQISAKAFRVLAGKYKIVGHNKHNNKYGERSEHSLLLSSEVDCLVGFDITQMAIRQIVAASKIVTDG
jgi:hypothetical protein